MVTTFKRYILGELTKAYRKQGIEMCFYCSIMDWHYPDWPAEAVIAIEDPKLRIRSAALLNEPKDSLQVEKVASGWKIHLPETAPEPIASVVVIRKKSF